MHLVQATTSDRDEIPRIEWTSVNGLGICLRLDRVGFWIVFLGKAELY